MTNAKFSATKCEFPFGFLFAHKSGSRARYNPPIENTRGGMELYGSNTYFSICLHTTVFLPCYLGLAKIIPKICFVVLLYIAQGYTVKARV